MTRSIKGWAFAGLLAAVLVGCGGGGGGGGSSSGGGSTPGLTITGVAATGAAFTDATVSVIDSRGVTVGSGAAIGTDGTYSITLAAGAVAPFVLIASRTDANGDTQQLVSVIASATDRVANITPITTPLASIACSAFTGPRGGPPTMREPRPMTSAARRGAPVPSMRSAPLIRIKPSPPLIRPSRPSDG